MNSSSNMYLLVAVVLMALAAVDFALSTSVTMSLETVRTTMELVKP